MNVLVCDDIVGDQIISDRKAHRLDRYDEVWDGVYVLLPIDNNEHQELIARIGWAFREIFPDTVAASVFGGINVSDREVDWLENYRVPDVALVVAGNSGQDCGTHWRGGPDLAVEIVSPKDLSREKLDFYSQVGVRELWIIDRKPWKLEVYDLVDGQLVLQGSLRPQESKSLESGVLNAILQLKKGPRRPVIHIKTKDGKWTMKV